MSICTGVALGAGLSDNTVKLRPSKFSLAQNIGPLRYTGENRYSDRRLGRSFGYGASGISLTIYVYDYGIAAIPDGSESVPVCEQFERARHEIETGGNYQNVALHREVTRRMSDGADATLAREAVYEFDRNGIHAVSALWVTAIGGYFVKLRLSLRAEVADEFDEASARILQAMANSFAAANPRRFEAPPAQEAGIEVDAAGARDAPLWLAYGVELARIASEAPRLQPPCGGVLTPDFAAELSARRRALEEYHQRAPAEWSSDYFDLLARVEAAGLLPEYVWHYLRSAALDSSPPANLQLAVFEEFRQRELAGHLAQTGAHVRVNTVRPLPPATAAP